MTAMRSWPVTWIQRRDAAAQGRDSRGLGLCGHTRTITGKVWSATVPGEGAVIHDVGRITMTLDTHEVLFLAGPQSVFFSGGIDPVVCARLAG